MSSILLIGNCQVQVLASSLKRLIPEARIDHIFLGSVSGDSLTEALEGITRYDHVLSHPIPPNGQYQAVRSDRLSESLRSFNIIPSIVFTGYHPDTVIVPGVRSPTGNYHSGLALACYLHGLSVDRAITLFNAYIYSSLGYFEEFQVSKEFLVANAAKHGYDLEDEFEKWTLSGPFMHSVNHPKARVLSSLSRLIGIKKGLLSVNVEPPELPVDILEVEGAAWPIYPELASAIGLEGRMIFRKPGHAKTFELDLERFVSESFTIYRSVNQDILRKAATRQVGVLAGELQG